MSRGGKHSRPFITLAVYDALTEGKGTEHDGAAHVAGFSDSMLRAAMSIETFHKASLVHDDIEDDDAFRYGDETLHRKYGTPTAINIGDYLIGLGYRLVSRETQSLGHEAVAEILNTLADAHMRLSEGQGAELMWRDSLDKQLKPLDALKIYALKTAPAFEAAVLAGIRMAGETNGYAKPIGQFARHLGVAFQILNDLKDWHGDEDNKLGAGLDVIGGRPTVLLALALETLAAAERAELLQLVSENQPTEATMDRVRQLYVAAGVFDKAHRLVDKYQQRAEEVADAIEPEELRRLFYYLIDNVLDRADTEQAEPPVPAVVGITMPSP
jgi:geranylgeranyl pyrophosphate synthase